MVVDHIKFHSWKRARALLSRPLTVPEPFLLAHIGMMTLNDTTVCGMMTLFIRGNSLRGTYILIWIGP
jgi:hypothetical protein